MGNKFTHFTTSSPGHPGVFVCGGGARFEYILKYLFIIILLCEVSGSEIGSPILSIYNENRNEMTITIDTQTHIDYGLAYPVTYEFTIPAESSDLQS